MSPLRTSSLALLLLILGARGAGAQALERLEVSDGATIAYRVTGQGPPLLFLHGFMGTMANWDEIAAPLTDQFTIITLDLRGHGWSTNPQPWFDHETFADDAIALMDELGFEQFSAVGHSAGALALLHLSRKYPTRVSWQVLIAAPPTQVPSAKELSLQLADNPTPEFLDFVVQRHPGGPPQIERLLQGLRDYASERTDIEFSSDDLKAIPAPTLVVWGDRDHHPIELAVRVYREIPNASLWVLPDMGHLPFWEEAEGRSEAVEELVRRLRVMGSKQ